MWLAQLRYLDQGFDNVAFQTLLMNRIQHIVVPPRRSMVYRLTRSRRSIFHAIFYSIFPVDLSSTLYRIALFLPSLYLLLKSTFLLFIIILQVFDVFPSVNIGWLQGLGEWAAQKEMSDICWFIYKAVCLALVFEALTRGLEGINNANATPFNIVSNIDQTLRITANVVFMLSLDMLFSYIHTQIL